MAGMGVLDRFSLSGKTALVTGAGQGIGRRLALAFAEAGADVALNSPHGADLEDVAAEGRASAGGRWWWGDVSSPGAREIVERAIDGLGHLDILLNAAWRCVRSGEAVSEAQFDLQVGVNSRAATSPARPGSTCSPGAPGASSTSPPSPPASASPCARSTPPPRGPSVS